MPSPMQAALGMILKHDNDQPATRPSRPAPARKRPRASDDDEEDASPMQLALGMMVQPSIDDVTTTETAAPKPADAPYEEKPVEPSAQEASATPVEEPPAPAPDDAEPKPESEEAAKHDDDTENAPAQTESRPPKKRRHVL